MSASWPIAVLRDHYDLLVGFAFKSEGYCVVPPGIRVARGDNVTEGQFRWGEKTRFWPEVTDEIRRYLLKPGDVLVGMDGSKVGRNWTRVRKSDLPCLLVQRVACLRARASLDQGYLALLISSDLFKSYVDAVKTGSSIPHISGGQIGDFAFPMPPLNEQRAIAHILGTLDDKIELNRRMNETLEEMARALFKSWFVDFDPVRRKAEGRDPGLPKHLADLFPSRFVDSELGEIPEGWRVGQWRDTVTLVKDSRNPGDEPATTFHHFSIPAYDEGQEPKRENGADIKSLKFVVGPEDVLLSKLNPAIERVWHIDLSPSAPAVCSTEFLVLRPRAPFHRTYVYCAARSAPFRTELQGLVTGTSNSHQRVQPETTLDLATVLPPPSVLASFESVAAPLLGRIHATRRETRVLASTRDALLPKLISGELRVKDADRFFAKVIA